MPFTSKGIIPAMVKSKYEDIIKFKAEIPQ